VSESGATLTPSIGPRRGVRSRDAGRLSYVVKAGLAPRFKDILFGLLGISSEGVVVADHRQRILMFSKGAEEIFGYEADEVLGRHLEILLPTGVRQVHKEHVKAFTLAEDASLRMDARGEVRGQRKNGEVFPLEAALSKLPTQKGMIFTIILRDTTERHAAQTAMTKAVSQAVAANRAKTNFLATMGHEIRTPLNGVLGMAQAMENDYLPADQRERLGIIRQSGESLLAILNDLLDVSKIEAGKLEIEETRLDLDELARGVHATFAAVAAHKGLNFSLDITAAASGLYRGDPLRVRQILHNLISNALKFTSRGGVKIHIGRCAGVLQIAVRDTGIGIPAENIAHVFDAFEQLDASTTRRYGGSGLGLAISRNLAELMGGTVSVSSRVGKGTVFSVSLPLAKLPRSSASQAKTLPATVMEPGAMRVLIVEDNKMNQVVLKTLLDQVGVTTVVAPDGLAAVAAWQKDCWDLILMDIHMPNMDGIAATGEIRRLEQAGGLKRTPIIALTANAMDHEVDGYKGAGMDGFVAKPIEVAKLLSAINGITDGVKPTPAPVSASLV
jgi:PAS domain S-box-containing protein